MGMTLYLSTRSTPEGVSYRLVALVAGPG